MQRFFKGLMLVVGMLLLGYVGFVAVVRWLGPSAEQRAALELMRQPTPPVKGRDGSDALWLLSHEVPAAKRAEAARELREFHERFNALMNDGQEAAANALVNPLSAYREFPKPAEDSHLCELNQPGCLARISAELPAVQGELDKFAGAIAAANELLRYDGVRWNRTPGVYQTLPAYNMHRSIVYSHLAWRFVNGETLPALAATCDDIAAWRRLGSDNDMLIGSMVGAAYVRQNLGLMAEMLSELPADTPLPPNCQAALAPTRDNELDLCPAMRSEFRMLESSLYEWKRSGESERRWERWSVHTVDNEHLLSISASQLMRYCGSKMTEVARKDLAFLADTVSSKNCSLSWRFADPMGCILGEIASTTGSSSYANRRIDLAAALALMRTVLWLRAQSPDPHAWPPMLAQRPAELGLLRKPTISADGARIAIPLLDSSRDAEFSLALTAAVVPAVSTTKTK